MNLIYETDRLILKVLRPEAAKKGLCFYLDNKEHFEKYGRSDVTFTKLDDEHFLMDFSVARSEME